MHESTEGWLVGDGEIVELIRAKDWSQTALGPIDQWPESLRTTVSLSLASSFPINVIWGPGAVQIWNEAYSRVCGEKHPREFASDYRECWASAWPAIGGAFETARNGETAFLENQPMFLDRNGYLEETWFTFSLSPIRDESGAVVGLFHPVAETTARMLADRRTRALRDLGACAAQSRSVDAGHAARAAHAPRLRAGSPAARALPRRRRAPGEARRHDRGRASADRRPGRGGGRRAPAGRGTSRTWARTPAHTRSRSSRRSSCRSPRPAPSVRRACCVAGISTRLPLDETYRGFFDLVAQGVTSALANALAYEQERSRTEALAEHRPREDGVLLQRLARVPHAADADARTARGRAREPTRRSGPRQPRARWRPRTATACGCCGW